MGRSLSGYMKVRGGFHRIWTPKLKVTEACTATNRGNFHLLTSTSICFHGGSLCTSMEASSYFHEVDVLLWKLPPTSIETPMEELVDRKSETIV